MEMLSGGEMIVRALEDEGVAYIFRYPGGAALHIYDALLTGARLNFSVPDQPGVHRSAKKPKD